VLVRSLVVLVALVDVIDLVRIGFGLEYARQELLVEKKGQRRKVWIGKRGG
jgi:hypothetical protein